MSALNVTAAASPLFNNFLMCVSVSDATTGAPTTGLKPPNFLIAHLASLNHAAELDRTVSSVKEGPPGFYIVQLAPWAPQPTLPAGHYVFAVAVNAGTKAKPTNGQTVAWGAIP